MNTGIISKRYANALLLLTQESGRGEQVCEQIRSLLRNPDNMPERLEPDLEKLVSLLSRNGREEYLKFIFQSYVRLYCHSAGVRVAHLTTAVPAPDLGRTLCELITSHTGYRVILETTVDPGIVGGFVFEFDDYLVDASVRSQIETVRRQFVEKNTRLV